MLEREQFDVAPLPRAVRAVPVARILLRLSTSVNVGDLPRLRRLLAVVRVRPPGRCAATPRGSTAGSRSARAARHFIDRYFPGDYKVIPNGVDIAPLPAGRADRPLAGRHARTSCSSGGSSRARACSTCSRRYRILRKTGCECRLLVVGGGPQEREARRYVATRAAAAASSSSAGSATTRRRQLFRTADVYCLAGDRRRVVRDRPARGDGRGRADRRVATSTATRASSGAVARACSCRRATRRSSPRRSRRLARRRRAARRDGRRRPERAPRSSAGRG